MCCQAQVRRGHRKTLPAHVLPLDYIPQPETHVKTSIGQLVDAARDQRVGPSLTKHRQVWQGHLIQPAYARRNRAKLAAALQVGLHDVRNFLRRGVLPLERRKADGQLGQADPGDFNAELGVHKPWQKNQHHPQVTRDKKTNHC